LIFTRKLQKDIFEIASMHYLYIIMILADYYLALGLGTNAGMDDVKKAFRQKAKLYHPDINPSPNAQEEFVRIHTAYEFISHHLTGKTQARIYRHPMDDPEVRKRRAAERAEYYARMRYEE